jgi:glucosamine--fructose-6-phosphate aminotransferase (isomerizing)
MCGIVGYVGKNKNALPVLFDGLKNLEYRGYDSAGVAYRNGNKVDIVKENGKVENVKSKVDFTIKSNLGIGHTRWATHGVPNVINSHPHKVGKITVVHNGIIENYEELRLNLIKTGYQFKSETDSEVACALIDKLYNEEKDMIKALNKCRNLLHGSYALGIICDDELDVLYAIRKDSPLIVGLGDNENYIASDVPAILKYTNKYILLDNDDIVKISSDNFEVYGLKLQSIKKEIQTFKWSLETALKNGYDHFMLKEIHDQPQVIKDTIIPFVENGWDSLLKLMPNLKKCKKIDIVACGSAYHAGLVGKVLIEKYADVPVNVDIASEYRYKKLFFDKNTLVIIISQSGETADSLATLRIANQNKIDTLAIVNVVGSSIAREAKYVLYTRAGWEIAVATTKAYACQVALLGLIALNIAKTKNIIPDDYVNQIKNSIDGLVSKIKETINKDIYKEISNKIFNHDDVFFIGRGIDYPLVMEGTLKLKEISYIHSEAYPAGELKHGTLSLINDGTPVIVVITDEDIYEKTINNIKEVKARGAKVILIITESLNKDADFYDEKIVIPNVINIFQSLIAIIPMQLIAYEIAKIKKCDIDKPRNLAKSVTVE